MSDPWKADLPVREDNIINESERSVNPADDEYKLVKLEADGRISKDFLRSPVDYQEFLTSGTWNKPVTGSIALVEMQAPGGGGSARNEISAGGGRMGTSGGNGGDYTAFLIPFYLLENTVSVIVGSKGIGAEIISANTAINGGDGGLSSFGIYAEISGGLGGVQGSGTGNQPAAPSNSFVSPLGITAISYVLGGRAGAVGGTSAGATVNPGENTVFTGAGGGGVGVGDTDGSAQASAGGTSTYAGDGGVGFFGATGIDADDFGGGGGGALRRGGPNSLKAGDGGAGYIRVYVF
jgi:hypothetical protein